MRVIPTLLLLAVSFASHAAIAAEPAPPAAANFQAALKAQLETSRDAKKGLMFYVGGQAIPGVVKEILPDAVVVSNQEYGRIVIRLERIDAAAAN